MGSLGNKSLVVCQGAFTMPPDEFFLDRVSILKRCVTLYHLAHCL